MQSWALDLLGVYSGLFTGMLTEGEDIILTFCSTVSVFFLGKVR